MKIPMLHTEIGAGVLTDEHAASSYGQPVFVAEAGEVYGPGDKFPRCGVNVGYLHRLDGESYSADDEAWVTDYIIRTHTSLPMHDGAKWLVWNFGASWKNLHQLKEIERINNKPMARNA